MNKINTYQNYLSIFFNKHVKKNYKIISVAFILIFVVFLSYQFFSYLNIKNIHKNSIVYFNAKDLDLDNDLYKVMEKLSSNKDFYSVISTLEIININLKNNNLSLAEELYKKLLNDKKLNSTYIAAIASHAAYTFLNAQIENLDVNLAPNIDNFISYINDNLNSYKGVKLELKYLLKIIEQDINNLSPKNDSIANNLYNQIMESNDISSSIKERVNKIHEFQIYK